MAAGRPDAHDMVRLWPLLALTACVAIPDPRDRLTQTGRADANGHSFIVNFNAKAAQATRTNFAWRADVVQVGLGAVQATERVTGCDVMEGSLSGDVALFEMALDC